MVQSRLRIFTGLITVCFLCFIASRIVLDLFFSRYQMVWSTVYSHEQQQIVKIEQKLMLMWTTFFSELSENRLHFMNECPDLKVSSNLNFKLQNELSEMQ